METTEIFQLIDQEVREWIFGNKSLTVDIFSQDLSYEYQLKIFYISLENLSNPKIYRVWTYSLLNYPKLDPRIQRLFLDLKNVNNYIYVTLYFHPNLDPNFKEYIFNKNASVRQRLAEISSDLILLNKLVSDRSIKVRFGLLHNQVVAEQENILKILANDSNSRISSDAKDLLNYPLDVRVLCMNASKRDNF